MIREHMEGILDLPEGFKFKGYDDDYNMIRITAEHLLPVLRHMQSNQFRYVCGSLVRRFPESTHGVECFHTWYQLLKVEDAAIELAAGWNCRVID